MKCLGCDGNIPWDGKGLFAYTCPCGATIFYDENKGFGLPSSLIMALYEKRELPHIDYYLGKSSHWSQRKEEAYQFLKSKGAIWSWECEECRQRVLERAKYEKTHGLYRSEFHPELEKLISA